MHDKDSLRSYRAKRHFEATTEPRGRRDRQSKHARRFVIQKHDARSLHYDFRLEADGVLKSWAVPRGPSTDPREKRLAMATEDHPLEYADFEGVIPEGEYGAGAVIVWDTGTYRPLGETSIDKQLEGGHATFWLDGEKLRGGYALQRMARGRRQRWLLVKMDDDQADARRNPVSTQPKSVLSTRTVEEVAAEGKHARHDERKA
jgi:DNA ligase D-like protein (predicted 3'-phosphoesterase)